MADKTIARTLRLRPDVCIQQGFDVVFNSLAFAIFLPVFLAIYYCLNYRIQRFAILLASYFFYGWWDWRFLFILWISTIVDYCVGRLVEKSEAPTDLEKDNPVAAQHRADGSHAENSSILSYEGAEAFFMRLNKRLEAKRKGFLIISIIANLALLGFFKYFNFFIQSADAALMAFGFKSSITTLSIVLPVGISFFTFQSMAYAIDVYRGKIRAVRNFLDYAIFVSYFPQLVNGPIERADHMIKQYANPRVVDGDKIYSGLMLMFIGFFKKIAIADSVAPIVDTAFKSVPNGGDNWSMLIAGVWLFAIQIYCDFSGYTDIARGTSRLLGIELMENFQQPYLSRNITEFWRRWHISLSSWLRDYLYIPLGGNRNGTFNTYRNLFLTMLLGGLWHGANFTYIIWGGLHGIYLAIHKWMLGDKKSVDEPWRPWHIVKLLVTLHAVLLAWIFFHPTPVKDSFRYIFHILTLRGTDGSKWQLSAFSIWDVATVAFFGALVLLIDIPQYRKNDHLAMLKWSWPMRGLVIALMLLLLLIMGENNDIPFIYFQF